MAHVLAPRMISEAQVLANLSYRELIPGVERALGIFSKRNDEKECRGGVYPQRTLMSIKEHDGCVFVMPVFSPGDDIITTKVVASYHGNTERYNIPSHMSTIMVNEAKTGAMKAIIAGETLTGMRTAAASAVATKYLAREGSSTLAILGGGTQAECHVGALRHVMNFSKIYLWTRSFAKAEALASKFDLTACETAEEAVKDADVIVTCTGSTTPVLKASWLKPGFHINCVGACTPWSQELDVEIMRNAVVYSDNTPGALQESGDIIKSGVGVFGEIGEVINGTKEARRNENTVFKSQGVAVEDAVAARIILDQISSEPAP